MYPNYFAIHAVGQNRAGAWVTKEVYAVYRVVFDRIEGQAGGVVQVRLRPNVMTSMMPGETSEEWDKRAARINKPFVVSINLPDD
jgi:hypothetical protein